MSGASYPSLQGRLVIVTGGASGIGAELVKAFHQQGCRVAFLDIDRNAAVKLQEELPSSNIDFLAVDVREVDSLRAGIRAIVDSHGPVNVLVNNVGWDERRGWREVTPEFWDECQAVNLRAHFFASQEVAESMAEAGGGSIINLGSNSWMVGVTGMPAYLTAKAGIVGLTRALARELGPVDIRVNAVIPGWVMTERQLEKWLTPEKEKELLESQCLRRTLQPSDVAQTALFLASDDSRMITNQCLVVDGGRS